jgi:hypothetical protein
MSLRDKIAQIKIENLESQMKNHYSNVRGIKKINNNHVINMRETKRLKYSDGIYMYTIEQQNASHGVLIFKETLPNNKVKLSLFDPNGKRNINSGYRLHFNEIENIVSYEMTPLKVWNDYFGHCGLWCIIFIILYNNFDQDNRKLFDMKIAGAQNYDFRKAFIDDIYGLVVKSRGFDTLSETDKFVQQVKNRITSVILHNQ